MTGRQATIVVKPSKCVTSLANQCRLGPDDPATPVGSTSLAAVYTYQQSSFIKIILHGVSNPLGKPPPALPLADSQKLLHELAEKDAEWQP